MYELWFQNDHLDLFQIMTPHRPAWSGRLLSTFPQDGGDLKLSSIALDDNDGDLFDWSIINNFPSGVVREMMIATYSFLRPRWPKSSHPNPIPWRKHFLKVGTFFRMLFFLSNILSFSSWCYCSRAKRWTPTRQQQRTWNNIQSEIYLNLFPCVCSFDEMSDVFVVVVARRCFAMESLERQRQRKTMQEVRQCAEKREWPKRAQML